MAPQTKGSSWRDLFTGATLQCCEAATLGMPFEVWKTRMGRFRNESSIEAFKNIYKRAGPLAYWQGISPKLVESASKGAVLLYSKELLLASMESSGFGATTAGFVAGAGAGVCQTVVMGPSTFLVTAVVTAADKKVSVTGKMVETFRSKGVKGFYPGGTAIAFRQATNWASRQGFTDFFRSTLSTRGQSIFGDGSSDGKLSVAGEIVAGILGGTLSTWNQPFEVARIHMQAAASEGKPKENMIRVFRSIVRTEGPQALFAGIVPRIGLAVWQTLFMVTGARLVKEYLAL